MKVTQDAVHTDVGVFMWYFVLKKKICSMYCFFYNIFVVIKMYTIAGMLDQ